MESQFLKPSIFWIDEKSLPTCQLHTVILSPISWTTLLSVKQIFVSLEVRTIRIITNVVEI